MHRCRVPLTCSALLRSLFPAARLLGVIGSILLVCSCSGNSSTDAPTASASTPTASASPPPPSTSPPPPSTGYVSLAWDAVSAPNLKGYWLYYSQTSRTYTSHIDVGTQTTYTVTGLTAGQTYYFAVTAYDGTGNESPFSNEAIIIATPAPAATSMANSTRLQASLPVAFTDASTGASTGPGNSSTAMQTDQTTVASALLEVGELTVDFLWKRVTFRRTFIDPIVVATPLSSNDFAPATVRIRNVGPAGFEIRVEEWDYLDGVHAPESVSYLAMERGPHVLGTGIRVEAGRLATNELPSQPFTSVTFSQAFGVAPVVLTAVTSVNEADAVITRLRSITSRSFEVRLQEQMNHVQSHATGTIDYIAWEPSSGSVDGLTFEVQTTPDVVVTAMSPLQFTEHFLAIPMFLAAMQTTNGWEPATLRWDHKEPAGVEIQIQDEASGSDDAPPLTEVVGYMAFTSQ